MSLSVDVDLYQQECLQHRTAGVVICTHLLERLGRLQASIASIAAQNYPVEKIVVVVDGTPELAETIKKVVAPVEVLCTMSCSGVSYARNIGAAALDTDVVLFLDDDAEADPDWVGGLVGVLTPGVLGSSGRSVPAWQGDRPWWLPDEFLWAFGCTHEGSPTERSQVRNVSGGCAAMLREQFEKAGGYDEALGYGPGRSGGGEEAELCLRMHKLWPDSTFVYEPAAEIHHGIPVERMQVGYFLRRCFAEGIAKNRVARSAGGFAALKPEMRFLSVLTQSPSRARRRTGHEAPQGGKSQVVGLVVGSMATITGFVFEALAGHGRKVRVQ